MKRIYSSPATQVTEINIESHVLNDSGTGVSVDSGKEVTTAFSREKQGGFGKGLWEE